MILQKSGSENLSLSVNKNLVLGIKSGVYFLSVRDILERYEYDGYGKRTVLDVDFVAKSSFGGYTNVGFTGQRLDLLDNGNLTMNYYKNRWYDTETGRFISHDPLGIVPEGYIKGFSPIGQYSHGTNIYQYVENIPVNKFDPFGLIAKHCCDSILPKLFTHPDVALAYSKATAAKDRDGETCLKDIGCGPCSSPTILGYYSISERKIIICTGNPPGTNVSTTRKVLIHELVHAVQCEGNHSCARCMKKEYEAYSLSNMCSSDVNCINRAWSSCSGKSVCAGKKAADYYGRFTYPPTMPSSPR